MREREREREKTEDFKQNMREIKLYQEKLNRREREKSRGERDRYIDRNTYRQTDRLTD
jgi:hypothetical protein